VMQEANGLRYMRARYYSPELMRFINADPIGFAGGMNWYGYCGNSPLSNVDPSGLVFGTPLSYGEFFGAAGSGAAQGAVAYGKGVAVGAVVTGAVILAAPAIASVGTATLIGFGVEAATAATVSSFSVTSTLLVSGGLGGARTVYNVGQNIANGDGVSAAYNLGTLVGGGVVAGSGGGRFIADYVGPNKSTVPQSLNPFTADKGYGFKLTPGVPLARDIYNVMSTAPTPTSGGSAAMFTSSGITTQSRK